MLAEAQSGEAQRGLERPELVQRAPQLVALRKLPLKAILPHRLSDRAISPAQLINYGLLLGRGTKLV